MTIQIEITKGYVKDRWSIRTGDIEGCIETTNLTEEDLIEEIKEQLKMENDLKSSNSQVTPRENAERTLEENKTKKPLVSPDTSSTKNEVKEKE